MRVSLVAALIAGGGAAVLGATPCATGGIGPNETCVIETHVGRTRSTGAGEPFFELFETCTTGSGASSWPNTLPIFCYKGSPDSDLVISSGALFGCPNAGHECAIYLALRRFSVLLNSSVVAAAVSIVAGDSILIDTQGSVVASALPAPGNLGFVSDAAPLPGVEPHIAIKAIPGGTRAGAGGFRECWRVLEGAASAEQCVPEYPFTVRGRPPRSAVQFWGAASQLDAAYVPGMFGARGWCSDGTTAARGTAGFPMSCAIHSSNAAGAAGGGALWLSASSTFSLRGAVRADGASADAGTGGAGSGGGIVLNATRFDGDGQISANGGSGFHATSSGTHSGGGGGGRIALLCDACASDAWGAPLPSDPRALSGSIRVSAAGGSGGATSVARRGLGVGGPGSVLHSLRNGAARTLFTLPADSANCGGGAGESWACVYASAGALVAVTAADALVDLVVAASTPRNATARAIGACGVRGAPDCYESVYVLGKASAQHGVYLGAAWPNSDVLAVRISLSNAAQRSASLTLDLEGGVLLSATGAVVGFRAPRVSLASGGAVTMGATRVVAYSAARIAAGVPANGSMNGSISLLNCTVTTGASDALSAARYPEVGVTLTSTGDVAVRGAGARLASCRAAVRVTSTAGDVALEAGQVRSSFFFFLVAHFFFSTFLLVAHFLLFLNGSTPRSTPRRSWSAPRRRRADGTLSSRRVRSRLAPKATPL